jgi:transglutaminase-like putative cysteine protease
MILNKPLLIALAAFAAHAATKDWKTVRVSDTLEIFSNDNYTGSMTHVLVVNEAAQTIADETRMHIESAGFSAAESASMDISEQRNYGFDGGLVAARQELKTASGANVWKLSGDNRNGWALSVNAGGTTSVRKIATLPENLNMTFAVYDGMKKRSLKTGMVLYDTLIDLTSGRLCATNLTCKETPSLKNGSTWVFTTFNDITAREERWELDTCGRTIYQEVWPYVARKKTGNAGRPRAPALFETLAVPVARAAADSETVLLKLDASLTPDSSVCLLYRKNGKNWALRTIDSVCPGTLSKGKPNSGLTRFTLPTSTMQSDDARIVRIADSLVKGKRDRCDSVRACFEFVNTTLRKQYSPTFSNAVETLKAGFGDCGEHSVLLGALLRAVRIPARVTLGLVYMDGRKSYVYHAWVAADFGGVWVFVDPTLGVFPAVRDRVPLVFDDTGDAVIGIVKLIGRIGIDYIKK